MTDLQWALDAVKALGVAGGPVFAILFWLERGERKEAQKAVVSFLTQLLTVTNAATNSITEVTKVVAEVATSTNEVTSSLAQIAQMIRSLGSAVRRGADK